MIYTKLKIKVLVRLFGIEVVDLFFNGHEFESSQGY
jgi:hypothetical protein